MPARLGQATRIADSDAFSPLPTYLELAMAAAAATAYDGTNSKERRALLSSLSTVEKLIAASITALALYGFILIGDGLYIKAKAELSQLHLKRAFAAEPHVEETNPGHWRTSPQSPK
ncbi:hypothetical protein [Rhizobium sp. Root1220]|uniref:hypothetical protein n=1 Tax=Rhizobium sp. Root1220 TaxID=1736432 RepID=UPI0006F7A1AD|nr:hypothetical protein [Rhizobium sp. Root1220]KQV64482.1 hypothetical protein ASC90_16480 [Rhizobium sp. Root1220]